MSPKLASRDFLRKSTIKALLLGGLGVEDIALRLGEHVSLIRFEVRRLREAGELAEMFRGVGNG